MQVVQVVYKLIKMNDLVTCPEFPRLWSPKCPVCSYFHSHASEDQCRVPKAMSVEYSFLRDRAWSDVGPWHDAVTKLRANYGIPDER